MNKPYMTRLAKELKALAKSRGLAVDDIAEAIGMSRSAVFTHFNGTSRPKIADVVKYLEWAWDPFYGTSRKFIPKNHQELTPAQTELAIKSTIIALHAIMNGEVR